MSDQELVRRCQTLSKTSGRPCGQPTVSPDVPYCAMHLQRAEEGNREARYIDQLPEELKPIFTQHMESTDVKDMTAEIALARTVLGAISVELGRARDDKNELHLTRDMAERLRDALNTLRGLVESQAKVKPDQVVTLYEMQNIIQGIISLFAASLDEMNAKIEALHEFIPPEKLAEIRGSKEQVLRSIMRQASTELQTRSIVIAFGAPMPKT